MFSPGLSRERSRFLVSVLASLGLFDGVLCTAGRREKGGVGVKATAYMSILRYQGWRLQHTRGLVPQEKKEKKLTKIFPPAARFFCARERSRIFPEPSRRVAGVPAPSIARPGVLDVSLGRSVLAQASRPRSVISLRTALLKPSWYLTQIRFSFRCMTPCGASIGAFAPASAPASTSALAGRSLCSWA